jgi:hypothetical protein
MFGTAKLIFGGAKMVKEEFVKQFVIKCDACGETLDNGLSGDSNFVLHWDTKHGASEYIKFGRIADSFWRKLRDEEVLCTECFYKAANEYIKSRHCE